MSICEYCAAGADWCVGRSDRKREMHECCPGGTWCDCQHKGTGWRPPLQRLGGYSMVIERGPINVYVGTTPTLGTVTHS